MKSKTLNSILIGFLVGIGFVAIYPAIAGSGKISWVSLIIVIVLIAALVKKKKAE